MRGAPLAAVETLILDGLLNFHCCMYINLDTIALLLGEDSERKSFGWVQSAYVAEVRKVCRTCCPRREFAVLLAGLKTLGNSQIQRQFPQHMWCDILMLAYSIICLISLRDWKDLKALSACVVKSSETQNVHAWYSWEQNAWTCIDALRLFEKYKMVLCFFFFNLYNFFFVLMWRGPCFHGTRPTIIYLFPWVGD